MSVLAVDIGGTNLRVAFYEPFSGLESVLSASHRQFSKGEDFLPERFVGVLSEALHKGDEIGARPRAIGISIAALLDSERGIVRRSENIRWTEIPLADMVSKEFGIPVRLETDTFCGALAERRVGGAQGVGSALYVAVGTGVGHAWILNDRVWRGGGEAANGLGHLTVKPEGKSCYCGGNGCLCQYASGRILGSALRKLGGLHAGSESREESIVDQATRCLGLALGHAIVLINPELIILGGGVVGECWPDLAELSRYIEKYKYPEVAIPRIIRSPLGAEANLIGAGLLCVEDEK